MWLQIPKGAAVQRKKVTKSFPRNEPVARPIAHQSFSAHELRPRVLSFVTVLLVSCVSGPLLHSPHVSLPVKDVWPGSRPEPATLDDDDNLDSFQIRRAARRALDSPCPGADPRLLRGRSQPHEPWRLQYCLVRVHGLHGREAQCPDSWSVFLSPRTPMSGAIEISKPRPIVY